jgi:hypothetical protein
LAAIGCTATFVLSGGRSLYGTPHATCSKDGSLKKIKREKREKEVMECWINGSIDEQIDGLQSN